MPNVQNTDDRWATFNGIGGDQVNITAGVIAMQCYHYASVLSVLLLDLRAFSATRSNSPCSV